MPDMSEAELQELLRRVRAGNFDAEADILEMFRGWSRKPTDQVSRVPASYPETAGAFMDQLDDFARAAKVYGYAKDNQAIEQFLVKAREHLSLGVAQGSWMPIETAPKTNQNTVIVWDDPVMGEAYYDGDKSGWWWANTGPGDYTAEAIYPTHWMPMPAPPSSVSSTVCPCAKCGCETDGEIAFVSGEIWCHPCADGVALPPADRGPQS